MEVLAPEEEVLPALTFDLRAVERPDVFRLQFWPRQMMARTAFWAHDEIGYGGAAGGGKSALALRLATEYCLKYSGVVVGMFRRTYAELEDDLIRGLLNLLPEDFGSYNATTHVYTFHATGSQIWFRFCERDADVYRYQGREFQALFLDEATHFSEFQVLYLMSRLRVSRPGIPVKAMMTTNPGNVGHAWYRKRFVDAAPPETTFTITDTIPIPALGRDVQIDTRRVFIPAFVHDNYSILQHNPAYLARLHGLPENQRRALLYGDWDVFEGQVFAEWNRDRHVVSPHMVEIGAHWPRWRAIDIGYRDPLCCLWLAEDPESRRIYVYRELYDVGLSDEAAKSRITTMSGAEHFDITYGDTSGRTVSSQTGLSTYDIYAKDPNRILLEKPNKDRIQGWRRIHDVLGPAEDGKPRLQVFSTCVNLIRTLPTLIYDEVRTEDVAGGCEDHAPEALRHGLLTRLIGRKKRTASPTRKKRAWQSIRQVA